MTAPDATVVTAYLADQGGSWSPTVIASALAAEKAAQAKRCVVPADDADWPADLSEALCRRVAHNLALRALPTGLSTTVTDMAAAQTRVGGLDAEVRRLEAPYRKAVVA